MQKVVITVVALMLLGGCVEDEGLDAPTVEKSRVAAVEGKADTTLIDSMCEELEREPGCDPCSVQNWYGDGVCDDFCPVRDVDCGVSGYEIRVDLAPGLGAEMHIVYQSALDSFSCTDLTWDGLNPRRVPEQVSDKILPLCEPVDDDLTRCVFTFENELSDECGSVIRHIYLDPSDAALTLEPWASLSFVLGKELLPDEVQVVGCAENNGLMMCGNDLLYHDVNGRANVALTLTE